MRLQRKSLRLQRKTALYTKKLGEDFKLVQKTALQQRALDISASLAVGMFATSSPVKKMQSRFGAIEAMTTGPLFIRKIASTLAKYPRPAALCATGAIVCCGALTYAATSWAVDAKANRKFNRYR
jgi:hypothetical protein